MNRDVQPFALEVMAQAAEAQSAASGCIAGALRELPGPAMPADLPAILTALEASRLAKVWEKITPDAVRDLLAMTARDCVLLGVVTIPEQVPDQYAESLLEFAASTLEDDPHHPIVGEVPPRNKLLMFASSVAFDRTDPDERSMATFAVLYLLWTIAHQATSEDDPEQ